MRIWQLQTPQFKVGSEHLGDSLVLDVVVQQTLFQSSLLSIAVFPAVLYSSRKLVEEFFTALDDDLLPQVGRRVSRSLAKKQVAFPGAEKSAMDVFFIFVLFQACFVAFNFVLSVPAGYDQ